MVSLTSEQTATVSRLLARAAASYNLPDSHHAPSPRSSTVTLSSLCDGDGGSVITGSPLGRAVVLALSYLSEESIASGEADRAVIIVLPNGKTLGAPYDLTGELTVTVEFDVNELNDGVPRPTTYDLETALAPQIARGLSIVMGSVVNKAHRERAVSQ